MVQAREPIDQNPCYKELADFLKIHADETGELFSLLGDLDLNAGLHEKLDKYLPLSNRFVDVMRFPKLWNVENDHKVSARADSDLQLYTEIEAALRIRGDDKVTFKGNPSLYRSGKNLMFAIRLLSLKREEYADLARHLKSFKGPEEIEASYKIFSINALKNIKSYMSTERYHANVYAISLHMLKFKDIYKVKDNN